MTPDSSSSGDGNRLPVNRIAHFFSSPASGQRTPSQRSSQPNVVAPVETILAAPLIDCSADNPNRFEIALVNGTEFRAAEIEIVQSGRTAERWLRAHVYLRRRPGCANWELVIAAPVEIPEKQIAYIAGGAINTVDDPDQIETILQHDGKLPARNTAT